MGHYAKPRVSLLPNHFVLEGSFAIPFANSGAV